MKEIIFSGFADEAAVSIEEQMDVFEKNGISNIEMRAVDGKHVLKCSDEELKVLKEKLDARGFKVSAIGSPIGKSLVTDDFAAEKENFLRAVYTAKILGCKYIRGFSFYIPKEEDPSIYAGEVEKRLRELVEIAEQNGLIYALENESGIFTDILERCEYIFSKIDSKSLKLAFDPGNFIRNKTQPYPAAYKSLKNRIAYFHIKDAKEENSHFVPCGEGDSNMEALLAEAYADGFEGYLSIEPHLKYIEDLNDAQRFTKACNALKNTLNAALGTEYELVALEALA